MNPLLSHSATILPVSDVAAAIDFYVNKLGFDCTFQWQDPPTYAVVKSGDIGIHLPLREEDYQVSQGHVHLAIFVHDVDAVYEQCLKNGVKSHAEIGDRDYGMRDFDIMDPDGFIIGFSQELHQNKS